MPLTHHLLTKCIRVGFVAEIRFIRQFAPILVPCVRRRKTRLGKESQADLSVIATVLLPFELIAFAAACYSVQS